MKNTIIILLAVGLLSWPLSAQEKAAQLAAATDSANQATNQVHNGPEMILVKGGTFNMGTEKGKRAMKVKLSDFYISKYEVSQKLWIEIMEEMPREQSRERKGGLFPIYDMNWFEAVAFCNRLSMQEGKKPCYSLAGKTDPFQWGETPFFGSKAWDGIVCDWSADGYRLPTEAEWEYAARGGVSSQGYEYSGGNNLQDVGWAGADADSRMARLREFVGSKKPNELGIHDMSGGVAEWCWDLYERFPEAPQPVENPKGSVTGTLRIARGGNWLSSESLCAVYNREFLTPTSIVGCAGIRLCRNAR